MKRFAKRTTGFSKKLLRFCFQLEKKAQTEVAEFKEISWLNINDRFTQSVLSSIYKRFNCESPEYFYEIYFPAEPSKINTQLTFQMLKQPLRKSNKGLNIRQTPT